MIFHENHLLADDSHVISYLIFVENWEWCHKMCRLLQSYVSSAAVVIGALRVKHYSNFLTDRSKSVLLLWIVFCYCVCLCHTVMFVPFSLVVTCWEIAVLLALLYVMFLCFCHIRIRCSGSGLVLDCIERSSVITFCFSSHCLSRCLMYQKCRAS